MKFYTNKTKPKCGQWIKILTDEIKIYDLIIVPENIQERGLKSDEFFWSEWKDQVVLWQYADKFDTLMKQRLHIGPFKKMKKE